MTRQLYKFEGEEITISSLKVTDRVISKAGGDQLYSVRLHIELILQEAQLAKVPLSSAAVALVEAGKRKIEGPNTSKLDIKRKFTDTFCEFKAGSMKVELKRTSVALTPSIMVVEGVPSLNFWVETAVSQDLLVQLVQLVKADGVKLVTEDIQGSMLDALDKAGPVKTGKAKTKPATKKAPTKKAPTKKAPTKTAQKPRTKPAMERRKAAKSSTKAKQVKPPTTTPVAAETKPPDNVVPLTQPGQ